MLKNDVNQIEIRAIEREFFIKANRYGNLEKLVELVLNIIKGLLNVFPNKIAGKDLIFGKNHIKRLYHKEYPQALTLGIREAADIKIINRSVALHSILNILKLRISPAEAVYNAWKNKNIKINQFICATDHPYIYAFILANRQKIGRIEYYQHGFYVDKYLHRMSIYDVGFTLFYDSYKILRSIYPKCECFLVENKVIGAKNPGASKIIIALPDFVYLQSNPRSLFSHTANVIVAAIEKYGRENVILRPHPLNGETNKWIKMYGRFKLTVSTEPIENCYQDTKKLLLTVPSTLKIEAERLNIDVEEWFYT